MFTFDWIYKYIFIADKTDIFVTKLNGENIFYHISNVTHESYTVHEICVNPIELFILWSESTHHKNLGGYIYKANYDGSNKISLINEGIFMPLTITIDYTIKRIYWIDFFIKELSSIDYNGKDKKLILNGGELFSPSQMNLYNGFIYWYNWATNSINKVNTKGGEYSASKLYGNFTAFGIIHSSRQPNTTNLCTNTHCTHLCLPLDFIKYRCLCPDINVYHSTDNCVDYV